MPCIIRRVRNENTIEDISGYSVFVFLTCSLWYGFFLRFPKSKLYVQGCHVLHLHQKSAGPFRKGPSVDDISLKEHRPYPEDIQPRCKNIHSGQFRSPDALDPARGTPYDPVDLHHAAEPPGRGTGVKWFLILPKPAGEIFDREDIFLPERHKRTALQ